MFSAEALVWLSRLSIFFNFLSFFLVAPEVLGQERLQRYVAGTSAAMAAAVLSILAVGLTVFGLVLLTAVLGVKAVMGTFSSMTVYYQSGAIITIPISSLTVLFLIIFMAALVFVGVYRATQHTFSRRVMNALIARPRLRQRFLQIGVGLYVSSALIQLMATM